MAGAAGYVQYVAGSGWKAASYQFTHTPGDSVRWSNAGQTMPALGRLSAIKSKYMIWGCLNKYDALSMEHLGHDSPRLIGIPSGMNGSFIDGSVRWADPSSVQDYYRQGALVYRWITP
jgi:hypothetical protein